MITEVNVGDTMYNRRTLINRISLIKKENPNFTVIDVGTMDMLPRIANAGYVAVPSKYHELSKVEGNYRGYIHHRWIYDFRDGKFIGFPKLSFIEYETDLHRIADKSPVKGELYFSWEGTFSYEIVNNDYMGPSASHVKQYYRRLL